MTDYQFTWERSRETPYCIEEKIDRVLASSAWHRSFPEAFVINEDAPPLDHSALVLMLGRREAKRKSRFRFENAWIREKCRELIKQSWNQPNNVALLDRIEKCGTSLEAWGCARRKRLRDQITGRRSRIRE